MTVGVLQRFFMTLWVGLQFVNVVFPDHTHSLIYNPHAFKKRLVDRYLVPMPILFYFISFFQILMKSILPGDFSFQRLKKDYHIISQELEVRSLYHF